MKKRGAEFKKTTDFKMERERERVNEFQNFD